MLWYNAPSAFHTILVTMNPLTISALSTHLKMLFEADELLRDLWVIGEVSNLRRAASGHLYFIIKDAGATVAAVMWRNSAQALNWLPQEGDQVLAHGYVSLYPERGSYQLYVNQMQPAGRGQLYARFEALKAQLASAGLFDQERKRVLVTTPQRIGIVTSADAAALRDILRVLAGRWPLVDVIVFPCLVQGADAPGQIVAALANANRYATEREPLDTLIVGRGGGSIEDLWAFNDERVAQAIAASAIPVISAVGHETDVTIADFVADVRAPTPTAAATMATPDRAELLAQLAGTQRMLLRQAGDLITSERTQLRQRTLRLERTHPSRLLDLHRQRLDDRLRRLQGVTQRKLDRLRERGKAASLHLDALNPRRVLLRGYSIVQTASGQVVTGPAQAPAGASLHVQAGHGDYHVIAVEQQQ